MPTTLTADQILALAPDPSSAKSGQGLASPRKWLTLGCNQQAAWGECQGSGRDPYRTQIDLSQTAFRCSCPSRKFPCKHGLGLLLLLASTPTAFEQTAPPDWVSEWLQKREQTTQKRNEKAATSPTESNPSKERKQRSAAQNRSTAREAKVAAGIDELSRWLRDMVQTGLANSQSQPHSFWETMAARLIDAQAPGLARMTRELAGIPASGEGWQARLLEHLAQLQLLISSYRRIEALPATLQADIRAVIGWSHNQDELLTTDGTHDRWLVLGQRVEEEDHVRVQRTWLYGQNSQRPALLLHFAAPGQPLERSIVPGMAFEADLVFFPSAYPLRALVKMRYPAPGALDQLPGYANLQSALTAYTRAIAQQPWLERFPMALHGVIPIQTATGWAILDCEQRSLPLAAAFQRAWQLIALSGGQPVGLFGEWDGNSLLPLSTLADGEFNRI